ncbi:MAG: glycosyltransferase family 2 protein [Parvularculaceae bacterium]
MRVGATLNTVEPAAEWTVVIPFYNEERFIAATLNSILRQARRPRKIILVDNGSTDASVAVISEWSAANPSAETLLLVEPKPGKVAALERGINAVETDYVALCDADTVYPPTYLALAEAMLTENRAAAALAFGVYENLSAPVAFLLRWKGRFASLLMPRQAHTGGYGQSYKTALLRAAGGYSPARWPFMVADHEIIHRVQKVGRLSYRANHFCITSARRQDRGRVDWRLSERILYHLTPSVMKDWFFYDFLAARFRRRDVYNTNLRDRDWETGGEKPTKPIAA